MKVSTKALVVIILIAFVLIFGALDLLPWQWDQLPGAEAP